jgi:hypothetical protein
MLSNVVVVMGVGNSNRGRSALGLAGGWKICASECQGKGSQMDYIGHK